MCSGTWPAMSSSSYTDQIFSTDIFNLMMTIKQLKTKEQAHPGLDGQVCQYFDGERGGASYRSLHFAGSLWFTLKGNGAMRSKQCMLQLGALVIRYQFIFLH